MAGHLMSGKTIVGLSLSVLKVSIRTRVVTVDAAKHLLFRQKHRLFKRFTFSVPT